MRPFPPCEGAEHAYVVTPEGLRMHVASMGPADGPVVVLLHGWPEHWWLWHEVMGPLSAAGYRVLAPDLRGFGWSEITAGGYDKEQFATDVLGLLDALGVDAFDLVGHDWGGWTAQLMAIRAPQRVRRLALLNIPHVWQAPGDVGRHLHRLYYQPLVGAPGLGPLVQRSPALWWIMRSAGLPKASVAEFRAALRAPGRAVAGSKVYRTFLAREMPAIARGRYETARISAPVRVLFGLDDVAIDVSMLDRFEDHADDVRITTVPDCGHFIVDEQPARVTSWLLDEVLAESV
ncbi:Soluble epoxide hydrolase [Paraconexibacter sp. AEG42_29]|uniref:Soluble epoxide hydrolase n=1 Tax=Paraconexibacter sp. AEG42_29 TaxID=2997339 RepID=A0AAU7B358_9ACTN